MSYVFLWVLNDDESATGGLSYFSLL